MPRPPCCRRIAHEPACDVFKPAGVPARLLEEVVLTLDEFEALRLADLNGMYQEEAAASMNVSRQTFGRVIESAHRKLADAIVGGKALRIEGGHVEMKAMRRFTCQDCQHTWEAAFGGGRPSGCPKCQSARFCRVNAGPGGGQGHRRHCGRHGATNQE